MPKDKDLYLKFELLFKEQYSMLASYAFSILKDEQDAEDIVQEVFIRIWQNSSHVIQSPQVKFYLLTATKNNCISFLRKHANKKFVQADLEQIPAYLVEETRERPDDLMAMINKALSLLPPQCLAVFKLSRFNKLTYQQIAEEMGLSVKTVENHISKALRTMRDYARHNNISISLTTPFSILMAVFLA